MSSALRIVNAHIVPMHTHTRMPSTLPTKFPIGFNEMNGLCALTFVRCSKKVTQDSKIYSTVLLRTGI